MEQPTNQEQMSAEELAERKEQMYKFYTESMRYLQAQFEYEEMLLKIDAARFERIKLQMQHVMMTNPPEDMEESQEEIKEALQKEIIEEQKERKLRKS